jgi:hypothetical protein
LHRYWSDISNFPVCALLTDCPVSLGLLLWVFCSHQRRTPTTLNRNIGFPQHPFNVARRGHAATTLVVAFKHSKTVKSRQPMPSPIHHGADLTVSSASIILPITRHGIYVSPSGGDIARHFCLHLHRDFISHAALFRRTHLRLSGATHFFNLCTATLGLLFVTLPPGNSASRPRLFPRNNFGGLASRKSNSYPLGGEVCGANCYHHLRHLRSRLHFCIHVSPLRLNSRP